MRILFFILVFQFSLFSQERYPKDYFQSPLDIPLQLSGTYGELRNNHFHSGMDFRTNRQEGLNVFAAADGYVSRIKISTFGYGKATYVTHPNGFTTVYAHLLKAAPDIEKYIKAKHYELKSFEIDVFPKPDELPVVKGKLLAFSGNTGGSGGPHLHFEFRDTKTEFTINPLLFGYDQFLKDTRQPVLLGILAYPLDENGIVNYSQEPVEVNLVQQKDGSYLASKVLSSGAIGFGVHTHDVSDGSYGKNGVYKIQSTLNGKPSFGVQFDTFSFDETRHINYYIDYKRYKKTTQRYQKLFVKNPYELSLVQNNPTTGIIDVQPNMNYSYKIIIEDFNKNKTTVTIPIQHAVMQPKILKKESKSIYKIKHTNEHSYVKDSVSVYIPELTFYEDTTVDFEISDGVIQFGTNDIALRSNLTLSIEAKGIPEKELSKYFIATLEGTKKSYNKTYLKDKTFKLYTRNLGKFALVKDVVAPKITPIQFKEAQWMSTQKVMEFTISDDLSGIQSYNGYLNGEWILFEYDYKTQKLTHDFSDNVVKEGRNDLKLIVVDNVGNSTIFETHFFRTQKP